MSPLVEFLCMAPRCGPDRCAPGKGNGDASVRSLADTPKYASFLRPPCVRLCVFVRCVRSHAAGAHEGTVHSSAPAPHDAIGNRTSHSSGLCRLPVRYRGARLLNGERTAWFQTLAGRRPHAELAHLRAFPAHRTAASPLPSQWPSQQRSRTDASSFLNFPLP
jgi:hypothetical protein